MIQLKDLTPHELEILETLFTGIEGAIVIDQLGIIRVYTEHYERESGIKREDAIGRRIQDVFPDTRMVDVLKTGKPIIADLWELNGKSRFVSRIPIINEGQVIGAVGFSIFRHKTEAEEFVRRMQNTVNELKYYKEQVRQLSGARYSYASIIGESEGIREVKERIKMVSASNIPVLIFGETGTGKELVAHAVHQESSRREAPFVRVNCAGIPDTLIESELFGYEEGAFTGARKGGKPGKFELANRGSLFLDEIGDLSRTAQAKLLRALQENEIERIGSTRLVPVDVRIISASNEPLNHLVSQGTFRKDLLFRLNVFTIFLPPLRERIGDIPLLCRHFIDTYNRENGTKIEDLTTDAFELLNSYHWPGNVREFNTVMERACIDAHEGMISVNNLLRFTGTAKNQYAKDYGYGGFNLKEARREAEKSAIIRALQASNGNRLEAAKLLGISRSVLYTKLQELDINE